MCRFELLGTFLLFVAERRNAKEAKTIYGTSIVAADIRSVEPTPSPCCARSCFRCPAFLRPSGMT